MTTTHTQPAGCGLDSLEAIEQAATPGPWLWWTSNSFMRLSARGDGDVAHGARLHDGVCTITIKKADADFIVAARAAMSALIAAARAAQAPQGDTRQGAAELAIELVGVRETMAESGGFWSSCSGCHDTEDGHPTGPYSYSSVFGCALGSGCSECGGIGAVWDNTDYEAMSADWDKDDTAAPTAHTCTPADERALSEIFAAIDEAQRMNRYNESSFEIGKRVARLKCLADEYRTAQGAGTAPVEAAEVRDAALQEALDLCQEYFLFFRDNNRGDLAGAVDQVAKRVYALKLSTHPAPVSTAAATTASVSALTDQRILEIFNECGDGISTVGFARAIEREALAPSRAADGQQGASRAVLSDEQIDQIARAYFSEEWAQKHAKDAIHDAFAALARAPLPAQGDARLEVFIDWYLRGGEYAEINPNGHMVRTTREQILEWLDRAAQSRAQSDTTGENHG